MRLWLHPRRVLAMTLAPLLQGCSFHYFQWHRSGQRVCCLPRQNRNGCLLILFVRACAGALEERRWRFGSVRFERGSRNQNCRTVERTAYGPKGPVPDCFVTGPLVVVLWLWLQSAAVEARSELEVRKDSMAELKMGEFGVSKYGEAIYIASSVLHPSIWLGPC